VSTGENGKTRVPNRTFPGKYMLGSWQNLTAPNAQKILEEEVISTQQLMVVRCVYRPGSDFAAHAHSQEQITIVEDGTLAFKVNGDEITVGPGQMISVFPGVLHASRAVGADPVKALNIFHPPVAEPVVTHSRSARVRPAGAA
jgi:quercetin dioxygenase-like cupin family protein